MAYTTKTWSDADTGVAVLAAFNSHIRDLLVPQPTIDIDVFLEPKSQTTWNTLTVDTSSAWTRKGCRLSSSSSGSEIAWDITLSAGTWRIDVLHQQTLSSGIVTVKVDDVSQGTVDCFGTTNNTVGSATGLIIPATRTVTLKLSITTKNAGSAGYECYLGAVTLRRIDTLPTPKTWAAGVLKRNDLNANLRDLTAPPSLLDIDVFLPATANTNWSTITLDSPSNTHLYSGHKNSGGSQNDAINWDVILPAGTWRVDLLHTKGTDRGVYSVRFDGVEKGTIDGYNASAQYNQASSVTGITVASSGKVTVALVMATKHASSSSYVGAIQGLRLRRTDTPTTPRTWALGDEPTAAFLNTHVRDLTAPQSIIDINVFASPKSQTNWSSIVADTLGIYQSLKTSSGAQNAEMAWDVGLTAGTWRVDLIHYQDSDRGIYTVSLAGTSVGTIDGYNAAQTHNVISSITGVAVAASGFKELKLKMETRNASSSSYRGAIQALRLRRTDI